MTNNLYRIETLATFEYPELNGQAMLHCNNGIAFVKLHPVKLKAQPKRDESGVVHGRWTWTKLNGDCFETLVCSSCLSPDGSRLVYNYCPNCGAKMDLEG